MILRVTTKDESAPLDPEIFPCPIDRAKGASAESVTPGPEFEFE
jgi:hypothetical protein